MALISGNFRLPFSAGWYVASDPEMTQDGAFQKGAFCGRRRCCQARRWAANEGCVPGVGKPALKAAPADAGLAGALGQECEFGSCAPLISTSQRLTGRKLCPQTQASQKLDGFHLPRGLVNFLVFLFSCLCFISQENVNEQRVFNEVSPRR